MSRKRKKVVKMRGRKTHGYGSKKKHRGSGSKGGKGFGGAFKHKKIFLKKYHPEHFEKKKFKSLREKGFAPELREVNLRDLPREGEVVLEGCKVLAAGEPPKGIVVKATAFSEKAKEKLQKAGSRAEEV